MNRNLILGYWAGWPFTELAPFVASLHAISFDGDICIFVRDVSPDLVRTLVAQGIRVERAEGYGPAHLDGRTARFFHYLQFIARHGSQYEKVLLIEPRDTVFQADPFAVPWPADLTVACPGCTLADSPADETSVATVYGEEVARTLRDYPVSCPGVVAGTTSGMLQYLTAMTHELSATRTLDRAAHNYLLHMRSFADLAFDTIGSVVAVLERKPESAAVTSPYGLIVEGTLAPILHGWRAHPVAAAYVNSHQRFRSLRSNSGARAPTARSDTVLCFYHRPRDDGWLPTFLGSLRATGFAGPVHCVGELSDAERAVVTAHDGFVHAMSGSDPNVAPDNMAHLCFSQLLDQLASDEGDADPNVMVFDTARAGFLRNPFTDRTTGLSVFCEGPVRVDESDFNLQRVGHFGATDAARLHQPIISSAVLSGSAAELRSFYRRLLPLYIGRAELLHVQKGMQGAINRLCRDKTLTSPRFVHPNGAEVYFEIWSPGLPITTDGGIRIGGHAPALIICPFGHAELIGALRSQLRINPP